MYECLTLKELVPTTPQNDPSDDVVFLLEIMEWNLSNQECVFADLMKCGVEENGADMITSCLSPRPEERPASMDEVLENPFWKKVRPNRSKKRRDGNSIESPEGAPDVPERYEI